MYNYRVVILVAKRPIPTQNLRRFLKAPAGDLKLALA
jgi:hypothetical protein